MRKVTFYHAGCPVCLNAEQELVNMIDRSAVDVEIVHLGEAKELLPVAEKAGVKSVPAIVFDNGSVLHINYGAGIDELKN